VKPHHSSVRLSRRKCSVGTGFALETGTSSPISTPIRRVLKLASERGKGHKPNAARKEKFMSNALTLAAGNWNLPVPSTVGSIDHYISAVNRFPVLTPEEELRFARDFRDTESRDAAGKLVLSHLR